VNLEEEENICWDQRCAGLRGKEEEKKPNLVLKKIRVKVSLKAVGVLNRGGSPGNRVGELDNEAALSVNPHWVPSGEINLNNLVIIVGKRELLVGVDIWHQASIRSLPSESNKACGGKKGEEALSIAAQEEIPQRRKKGVLHTPDWKIVCTQERRTKEKMKWQATEGQKQKVLLPMNIWYQ